MVARVSIQAGGKSSRMGSDKAWLEIGERPMIERVLSAVAPLASRIQICIGSRRSRGPNEEIALIDDRYLELANIWDAEITFDRAPGNGPLGGILTALLDASATEDGAHVPVLIVACDLPFITTDFIELLLKKHDIEQPDITVPSDASGRLHPLAAIYSTSCLSVVAANVKEARLRVDLVFDLVRTVTIDYREYEQLPGSSRFLTNVNSRQDYDLAVRMLEAS